MVVASCECYVNSMVRKLVLFWLLLAGVTACDQGTKLWARRLPVTPPGCSVPDDLAAGRCVGVRQSVVAGYWDWELAENTGMAFSRFADARIARVALSLIAGLALVGIAFVAMKTPADQRLRLVALAAIAGGALGNLIDRVRDGSVTDFIRWRVHDHLWPVFNVADAALLVGVALLVLPRKREMAA
jgi:signal peptidase II